MKAYVIGYEFSSHQDGSMGVRFGLEPIVECRYATRDLAMTECIDLNRQHSTMGMHCCAFTVDELSEGDFGIICVCHPVTTVE